MNKVTENPWEVLGIDPSADKKAIKRAYTSKLKLCKPDEDPEGFQQLRAAYDAALAHVEAQPQQRVKLSSADEQPSELAEPEAVKPEVLPDTTPAMHFEKPQAQPGTPPQLNSELQEFDTELAQLLDNSYRRNQQGAWQLLIEHPVCVDLQSRRAASHRIFHSVLNYQKSERAEVTPLDIEVLVFLNLHFDWAEDQELEQQVGHPDFYNMTHKEMPEPEVRIEPVGDTSNIANLFIGLTILCALGLIMISI
ncbi:J domain-containing protein [Pseudoalteromonas sp. McH1-42]|uniref:J domain-containing protein n=1 Tax=Pseudoalteromonas sp. McH1-42 TaxID=2917752 RepID=UPI001EF40028|nr:J domain-containing protein [Pseudoalteromonas sp. McH1-42]MCG7563018.1 J domain-containing protein [Pseudoalteromonas sp. McH1-42]